MCNFCLLARICVLFPKENILTFTTRNTTTYWGHSCQMEVEAVAKKNDKHQRKFSLSLPLSFGVNRPLICRAILIPFTSNIVRDYAIPANSYFDGDGTF